MSASCSKPRPRVGGGLAVACLVATGTLFQLAVAAEKPDYYTEVMIKNRARVDKALESAHSGGKAIVIVATIGTKARYPTEALLDENLADEVTDTGTSAAIDYSMAVEWADVTAPDLMVAVALNADFVALGPSGHVYRFKGPRADYLVFLVEPGTYALRSINYPKPRSSFSKGHGTVAGRGAASIGEFRQVASVMLEAEQTTVFLDAATTTVAASEQCNWWYKGVCTQSVYTPAHTKQTRAAGLYPKTDYLPIPALDVTVKFDKTFASFQAGAGEVVLVDGLFAEPLDTDVAVGNCRRGESMQVCELQSIELTRANGSVDDLRGFDFAAEYFPRLGKLMGKVQYRPLQIDAKSLGTFEFGERYRVAAR